jgi:hypothetical protein
MREAVRDQLGRSGLGPWTGLLHHDAGAPVRAGRSFDVRSLLPRSLLQQRACGRTTLWFKESATRTDMRQNEDWPDFVRDARQG